MMLRPLSAALALSLAAGAADAANLRVLSADCDPSLATKIGLGVAGKICTASTSRNNAGRVNYGAADGAFYPLGLANGIVFEADPAFSGKRPDQGTPSDVAQVNRGATSVPGSMGSTRANPRSAAASGSVPGNGLALGLGGRMGNGAMPGDPLPPISLQDPVDTTANPADVTAPMAADSPIPVPLPAAGWLLLAGLGALGVARRRVCKA